MFYRQRLSLRGLFLVWMDTLAIMFSAALANVLVINLAGGNGWFEFVDRLPTSTAATLIFLIIFFAGGMYDPQVLSDRKKTFIITNCCVFIGLALITLAFYWKFKLHFGRGIMLVYVPSVIFSTYAIRFAYHVAVGTGFFAKATLLVGEGDDIRTISNLLAEHGANRYKVFGVVTTTETKSQGEFLNGVPVIGNFNRLREYVAAYDIENIIVATSLTKENGLLRELRPLRYHGVTILDFVSLHEQLAFSIPLDHIDDEWLLHAAMNSRHIHIRKLKRIMDFCVAAFSLVLTIPICLITIIAIKVSNKGPVFYRQVRMGLNGEHFEVIKFRTMHQNAEINGAVWAERYDARITRVGRFLRASRIDEIPQLVNVLRGEMSLVGPRPERPEFVETLKNSIPFYEERLLIPPGLTGWAQIRYPYAASVAAARHKLEYDLYYIKHTSLLMDVSILLRTFKTILVGLRHSEEPRAARNTRSKSKNGKNLTLLESPKPTPSEADDAHTA